LPGAISLVTPAGPLAALTLPPLAAILSRRLRGGGRLGCRTGLVLVLALICAAAPPPAGWAARAARRLVTTGVILRRSAGRALGAFRLILSLRARLGITRLRSRTTAAAPAAVTPALSAFFAFRGFFPAVAIVRHWPVLL
jgi:hypothetical protein